MCSLSKIAHFQNVFFVLPLVNAPLTSKASSALELRSHKINFYLSWQKSSRFTFTRSHRVAVKGAWKECVSAAIGNEHHVSFNIIFISLLFQLVHEEFIKWYLSKQSTARYVYHILCYLGEKRGKVVTEKTERRSVFIIYRCDRQPYTKMPNYQCHRAID